MICSKMKTKGPQHAPTMAFGSLRASQDHETEIPDLLGDAAGSKSSSIVPGASPGHPRTCDLHCIGMSRLVIPLVFGSKDQR